MDLSLLKMSKFKIIIVFIVAVVVSLGLIFGCGKTPEVEIPRGNINDLPGDIQIILSELEKKEYSGLTEQEIKVKLRQKGINF